MKYLSVISMRFVLLIACLSLLPVRAFAWNGPGHMIVANIAYKNLTLTAKQKVDELLTHHHDYARWVSKVNHQIPQPSAADKGQYIFMIAATFPDMIRGDHRFYDETDSDSHPTDLLFGFPDMKVHKPWHFYDKFYTEDNSTERPVPTPNAVERVIEVKQNLSPHPFGTGESKDFQAYDLCWLEHLVGDLHQPMHAVVRYRHGRGDLGGNKVKILDEHKQLHTLWDDLLGEDDNLAIVAQSATTLLGAQSLDTSLSQDPMVWMNESYDLAKTVAYQLPPKLPGQRYPKPDSTYLGNATQIAGQRAVLAGFRLADILNALYQ